MRASLKPNTRSSPSIFEVRAVDSLAASLSSLERKFPRQYRIKSYTLIPAVRAIPSRTSGNACSDRGARSSPFVRAIVTTCELLKASTGAEYIRFHGIFHDEVGLYDEDSSGNPVYNFSYIDQIYDGLLEEGVKPFVELSFMPAKLSAQPPVVHSFWYKPIVSPPNDWAKWDDLISHFAQHLIERYGIDEVSQWYFEVWNEPNLDFWAGDPKEETYDRLYDETARTLKSVDARLRVGGPATAQAAWVDRFIAHTVAENVPVDFVSTRLRQRFSQGRVRHGGKTFLARKWSAARRAKCTIR